MGKTERALETAQSSRRFEVAIQMFRATGGFQAPFKLESMEKRSIAGVFIEGRLQQSNKRN